MFGNIITKMVNRLPYYEQIKKEAFTSQYIQKDYDYGCKVGKFKLEVYRITHTTPDGLVTELTYPQIQEFCKRLDISCSYSFFYGKAEEWYSGYNNEPEDSHMSNIRDWREGFINRLQEFYNEKDCFMCTNKVPEEGVVVRKESLFSFEAYKLKSFRFLEKESKDLDKGDVNIEDNE